MGVFKRKFSRKGSSFCDSLDTDGQASLPSVDSGLSGDRPLSSRSDQSLRSKGQGPSLSSVAGYINTLETAKNCSGDKATRALRKLFALSEHSVHVENRTEMVRVADGRLVPVLLNFLSCCEKGGNEQYLTLLVLNNISIPVENKRLIAIDCGGAKVLSRMLCEDPSCHLIAIVLVNLTFASSELRIALVTPEHDIQLVQSLAFALRVASLTQEEYENRQPLVENDPDNPRSPKDLLESLLVEDERPRSDNSLSAIKNFPLPSPSKQLFPNTARWCLAAIKNLTRPSKDPSAAHALINCGIVPLVLRFVTIKSGNTSAMKRYTSMSDNSGSSNGECESSFNSGETPLAAEPFDPEKPVDSNHTNSPMTWDSHSAQDAALFVLMNLCAVSTTRDYIREIDTVNVLGHITCYERNDKGDSHPFVEKEILEFQRMKARMALAYLIGSEGHFGQPRCRIDGSRVVACPDSSPLIVTEPEVNRLVELLATTLHRRSKAGAGGYSASTFSLKYVLFALRCLLTNHENQKKFMYLQGTQLNTLLVKTLALHALDEGIYIDAEAAEHAVFSLYLVSNYCFKEVAFLPAAFGHGETHKSIVARVLTAYWRQGDITAAGKHATDQLLLRLEYLIFDGSAADLAVRSGSSTTASDFSFEEELSLSLDYVSVDPIVPGARPDDAIFQRPLLRQRILKKVHSKTAPCNGSTAVDVFPNALLAAQELSFGSIRVRHMNAIDDVLIANNIVHSANGEKTESYNCIWGWQHPALEGKGENLVQKTENHEQREVRDGATTPTLGLFSFCGGVGY